MKRISAFIFAQIVLASTVFCAQTYYSQASSAPNILANWNSFPGGGGASPADFTSGDTFVIQSGHTMTTTANWMVSGGATVQINSGGTLSTTSVTLAIGGHLINNGVLINTSGSATTLVFTEVGSYSGGGTVSAGTSGSSRINWQVASGSTLTLAANLSYPNTGSSHRSFTVNGTLDCGSYTLTGGSGIDFVLGNNATLITKNPSGINGSLLGFPAANFPLNPAANYVFNGSSAQITGSYLPPKVNSLTLSNSGGVSLSRRISVNSTLTTSGKLHLSASTIAPITANTLVGVATTTIHVVSENLSASQTYPLIAYTTMGGSGGFALGSLPAGATGTLDTEGNNISLTIATPPAPPTLQIGQENDAAFLKFLVTNGYSYRVFSSPDLFAWNHIASVRGQGLLQWQVPASELSYDRRFFRVGKVLATDVTNLSRWASFVSSGTGRFHIGLIGDSFTQARERYTKRLKQTLAEQYGNLGAGFLGFASYSATGLNGSVDESELAYTINYPQWLTTNGGGYGPDAGHVTSLSSNASLSIQVLKTVDSVKLYYANNPGTAGFRYRFRVNGTPEDWKTVATNAIMGLDSQTIDVRSYAAPYMVDIETLGVGVSLIGAEAIKTGNGIVVHKLGASGGRASHFAANNLSKASLNELNLDMAVIMFGTNEQGSNQTPASFKSALQTIITSLRTHNPGMDLILMLPCYTKYEIESPKTYKLQDYGAAMREVATANNAAFIDFTEVFGPAVELQNIINSGLMNVDRIHPTVTGAGSGGFLIADTIYLNLLTVP